MPKGLLRKASAAALNILTSSSANTGSSESTLNVLSHDAPSENGIPQSILAFRTITTLLQIIQQEQPFKIIEDEPKLSDSDRRELKLLSAFSTVAVAHHEVVAVVAKQCPGTVEVMACNYDDSTNQQIIEPPQTPSNFFAALFTKNFRKDDFQKTENEDKRMAEEEGKRRFPVIKPTEMPPDFVGHGDEGLRKYLEQPRSNPTLTTHLHILSRLLAMSGPQHDDEEKGLNRLLSYVITTCYPKMLRRSKHPVSQLYLNSLKEATGIRFSQPSRKLSEKEMDYLDDRQFLGWVHNLARRNRGFRDTYPKIVHQAMLAVENEPFQLFTEDTYKEFHHLLIDFLEKFQGHLTKLSDSCSPTNLPTQDFKRHLGSVFLFGRGLQHLSRTLALRRYLKNFRLQDFLAESLEQDEECENPDERDEELQAVRPFVTAEDSEGKVVGQIPLWQSYDNWLRLLVAHFDAVEILSRHFDRLPHLRQTLSLNILVAPVVDKALLPWRDLLNSRHFPPATLPCVITTDEIRQFLHKALCPSSKSLDFVQLIKTTHGEWGKRKSLLPTDAQFDNIRKVTRSYIKKWPKDMPEGWLKSQSRLIEMLDKLVGESGDKVKTIDTITNMIESLFGSVSIILRMETATIKKGFSGTLHCEACLASLLTSRNIEDIQDEEFEQILAQMKDFKRIIGVSKRCCPTCRYLLGLLTENSSSSQSLSKFIAKGSHNTITACTLPTWLPEKIVGSMNKYFGDQLRRELVKLIERPESFRSRTHSVGSERLSLDSLEGNFDAGDEYAMGGLDWEAASASHGT